MNPKQHYKLTEEQQQAYMQQPDAYSGGSLMVTDFRESFPFVKDAPLRFWYNTQKTSYAPHCHGAMEIITPMEQGFTVTAGDTTYALEPGDIFLIPSGMLHSYSRHNTGSRFIYIFEFGFLNSIPGFSYILSLLNRPVLISNDTHRDIYEKEIRLILQLAKDYWQRKPLWQMRIYRSFISFFELYGMHCMNQSSLATASSEIQNVSESLERLFEYVKEHFSEDISLTQAAAIAGYSKYYFSRIFKDCTGQTFMEYLRNVRISEAEKLLLDAQIPIATIAFQAGFASLPTFNRIFRQLKGCAPSEYRSYYAGLKT